MLNLAKSAKFAIKLYSIRVKGSPCDVTMRHSKKFLSFKARMVILNITMRVYLLKEPI